MAALKRSKRVTWPSDGNMCKVRLFLSEDEPYQSVRGTQDHLQAKPAWLLHAGDLNESNNPLPSSFESPYRNHPRIQMSQIPIIKWQCPPTLVLNQEWRVVTGEESQELHIENARQQGVIEAIFPHPSSIPPNPLISLDVKLSRAVDDSSIPLIPMIAAEVDDEDVTKQSERVTLSTTNHSNARDFQNHSSGALGAEPDVAAAAKVALTAIIKSSEEGSLIDHDLLIKLLSEPSMLNRLLSNYNVPKQTEVPSLPTPTLCNRTVTSEALNRDSPLPTNLPIRSSSVEAVPRVKDASYYKSLVQLHGGDRQKTASAVENVKNRDFEGRVQKPCIYFNTEKGCRYGESCFFSHDVGLAKRYSGRHGKRIKLDGRI